MVKAGLGATAVALAVMIGFSVYGFTAIPEDAMIPRHWGLDGQPDAWAPRDHVLVGMPLLVAVLSIVFVLIPAIDPRRRNLERSRGLYLSGWVGASALLALVHALVVVSAARGGELDPAAVLYGVAALIVIIGNYLAKSRSSWFIGVRTPWSLSSEHAWKAANTTTGWLFVLTGLSAAATAFWRGAENAFPVLAVGVGVAALAGVAASYFAWRRDPERHGAGAES